MLLLVFVVEMYLYLHEFMEIIFSSDGMLAVHFTPCTVYNADFHQYVAFCTFEQHQPTFHTYDVEI